eukprot:scaffold8.g1526.t1
MACAAARECCALGPDATHRTTGQARRRAPRGLVGGVIKRFEQRGFKLVAIKVLVPSRELAGEHYAEHKGKPFYPKLVDFLSSGAVVACVFEGKDIVKTGRAMIGATNPLASAPGTIRGDFAIDVGRNMIHGSDSVESADREISLWFKLEELASYTIHGAPWIYELSRSAESERCAAATPAFGAAPTGTSLFGAASTPVFGSAPASSGGFSFGGASAASPFGGAVSTPAFAFPSSSSAPSLFGASMPALGAPVSSSAFNFASSTPSLFGGASAPSLFGGATPSLFGAAAAPSPFGAPTPGALFGQQQVAAAASAGALLTKEGRPITHGTKWDDLAPQAQGLLLEVEKEIVRYREECKQLDADPRLVGGATAAAATRRGEEDAARLMRQVAELREAVMHLHRATESAVYTFKRSHAWREAAKAAAAGGSGQAVTPLEVLAGPVVLPSQFLRDAIAGFGEKLRQHRAVVAELEAVLARGQGNGASADSAQMLQALQGTLHNALDDRVENAKAVYLSRLRAAGDSADPFGELEREEQRRREGTPSKPSGAAAGGGAAAQPGGGGAPAAAAPGGFLPSPGGLAPGGSPLPATPGGLFGTVPAVGVDSLFGGGGQGSKKKPSSRRR